MELSEKGKHDRMQAVKIFFGNEEVLVLPDLLKDVFSQLKSINLKITKIMATIKELEAKVDTLQASIDAEQEAIKSALEDLKTLNEELKALIVDGGTTEERQAVADKLDTAIADIESTISDEEPEA